MQAETIDRKSAHQSGLRPLCLQFTHTDIWSELIMRNDKEIQPEEFVLPLRRFAHLFAVVTNF